ncbi:MAG: helix-turn-helix domain-containing protein [Oscillospiraceae bacterium]|nr:helix-turn-helix domain-containing protein [Oscillospiraceae bacterium]
MCRRMVSEQGLSALNMRSVAQACHVAVGSLYNYFPNKDDLVIATVARDWQDIFHMDQTCHANLPFPEYVQWIFDSVQQGAKKYPHFLTAHSLSFASTGKSKAKDTMEQYFSHIRLGMTEALHADPAGTRSSFARRVPPVRLDVLSDDPKAYKTDFRPCAGDKAHLAFFRS